MFDTSVFTNHTTDRLEQELVAAETLIARLRGLQTLLIREISLRQVPSGDGYRNLRDWLGARVDVSPETAGLMAKLASARNQEIDQALADGEVSFDRAVELTHLDSENPVEEAAGYGIPRLRRLIASRRRHHRGRERDVFADRHLALQPNLDHTGLRLWGELVGGGLGPSGTDSVRNG